MKETLNEILAEPITQIIVALLVIAILVECIVTFEYYKDKKMYDDGYVWVQKTDAHWEKGSK